MIKKLHICLAILLIGVLISSVSVDVVAETLTQDVSGLHVVLVLDVSSSMQNKEKPYPVVDAVRKFIDKIHYNGAKLSIVTFTGEPTVFLQEYELAAGKDYEGDILAKLELEVEHFKILNKGFNGTAIARAMLKGDELLSGSKGDSDERVAMLVYTDAINTMSAPSNEEDIIRDFEDGKYGAYPIYVIELQTGGPNPATGEKKMKLQNLGTRSGGAWTEDVNVEKIPDHFVSVAEKIQPLQAVVLPAGDDDPAPPTESQIVGIEIADTVSYRDARKMFDDEELVIQCSLKVKSGSSEVFEGNEDVYRSYQAKFYIKHEEDAGFRMVNMDVSGGAYKTRYKLPKGSYEYYVEICDGDNILQYNGEDIKSDPDSQNSHVSVIDSTPPRLLTINMPLDGSLNQSVFDPQELKASVTAKFQDEASYNDQMYYSRYPAVLQVKHNDDIVAQIPMDVENMAYTAFYNINQSGKYVFQVELTTNTNPVATIVSATNTIVYRKVLPWFILAAEAAATALIILIIFINRNLFFPQKFIGYLDYSVKNLYGESLVEDMAVLSSFMGSLTLKEIMGEEGANLLDNEWLPYVKLKPASNGRIIVSVKRGISAELTNNNESVRKNKLQLQKGSVLTLEIGDFRAVLRYMVY